MVTAPQLAGCTPAETGVCGLDTVATGACQQMGGHFALGCVVTAKDGPRGQSLNEESLVKGICPPARSV